MSVLQVESFDQELKILLVAQESSLSRRIVEYLYTKQIAVVTTPLFHLNSSNFINSLLQQNQFFKIIVVANFEQQFDCGIQENIELLNYLKKIDIPIIFVVRISSRINTNEDSLSVWKKQLEHEDCFINKTINEFQKSKVLIGQDVIVENNSFTQPYQTLFQAIPNGYLLDPQTELSPIEEADYFKTIAKELINPDTSSYLVRGSYVSSEELLLKVGLKYKEIYGKDLVNLDLETVSLSDSRFVGCEKLIEVTVPSDIEKIALHLTENINIEKLGINPQKIVEIKKTSHSFQTQLSKPFKSSGADFKFEPIGANISQDYLNKSQVLEKTNAQETIKNYDISIKENKKKLLKNNQNPKIKENISDNQISKLFSQKRAEQKTTRRSEKVNIISRIKKKSKNKQAIFFIGLIVFIFGVVIAFSIMGLAINYHRAQRLTNQNLLAFNNKEYDDVSNISTLDWQANFLDKFFDIQLIDKSRDLSELNHLLAQTSTLSKALNLQSINIYRQIFSINPQGEGKLLQKGDYFQLLNDYQEMVERLSEQILVFQAEIKNINLQSLDTQIQAGTEQQIENLRIINNKLQSSTQLGSLLPDLLAVNDRKKYYILLQDNQELRPTGGFIQAIAALTLEEGRLVDQQIYTTGWLDSKVLGDIASIPEVEEYLGEPRLHLRDANWDPDLSTSASQISWFLKESINQPIDGIITINYDIIRELLIIFGEIHLEEYGETITSSNLFSRLEQKAHEEKEYNLEKSFHTAILDAVLNKIKNASDDEIIKVQDVFYESLKNQQTGLYFSSSLLNSSINKLGWTGSILEPSCPTRFSDNCETDYLYQVEANVGVNKVNQYVTSQINHTINIKDQGVFHERQIKYNNKSHSNVWPLGNYKTYIRFYINKSAVLEKILIDGGEVPREFIKLYQQHGRTVVGMLVDIPAGSEKTVTLLYSTPHVVKKGGSYFYFEQPQPGVKNRLSSISVNHSEKLRSELISPLVEVNENQIVVTSDMGSGFIAIKFAQN